MNDIRAAVQALADRYQAETEAGTPADCNYDCGWNASREQAANDLRALLAENGWRQIIDAPKDGTVCLLCADTDDENEAATTIGWWQDAIDDGVDYMGGDAGFVDHNFCRYHPSRSFGVESHRYAGRQPTHWMPLPPALRPAIAAESGVTFGADGTVTASVNPENLVPCTKVGPNEFTFEWQPRCEAPTDED